MLIVIIQFISRKLVVIDFDSNRILLRCFLGFRFCVCNVCVIFGVGLGFDRIGNGNIRGGTFVIR